MKNTLKTRLAFGFLKAMKKASNANYSKHKRHHAIRAAAYASMAAAIGPRRAWSRAILTKARTPRKPMMKKQAHHHHHSRGGNPRNDDDDDDDDELGIGEELKDLSEVVPGGAAMDSWKLLNETGHYIKCLRAQVQIMTNILHYSSTS